MIIESRPVPKLPKSDLVVLSCIMRSNLSIGHFRSPVLPTKSRIVSAGMNDNLSRGSFFFLR